MKVVIVDDHEIVLEGLKLVIMAKSGAEVVGEATEAGEALKCIKETKPDVVVLDMEMPNTNGVLLSRQILSQNPATKIIIFSAHLSSNYINEALQEGVSGYLGKVHKNGELCAALDAVERGQLYLCAEAATSLAKEYRKKASSPDARLSDREQTVLKAIAEGRTTKAVAAELKVSSKTVETHRQNIMRKLNIDSVAGLTKYAVRHGLTQL